MFIRLGLFDQIKYGTFNELCELQVNRDGEVRDIVRNLVLKEPTQSDVVKRDANRPPEILLIDEVDVFFSPDFYGNIYTPQTTITHDAISIVIDKIWESYKSNLTLKFSEVKKWAEYQNAKGMFKEEFSYLFDHAVMDILVDVSDFKTHEYITEKGKIGYKS